MSDYQYFPPVDPPPPQGSADSLAVGDVFSTAWASFKLRWPVLVLAMVVVGMTSQLLSFIVSFPISLVGGAASAMGSLGSAGTQLAQSVGQLAGMFVSSLVGVFFAVGTSRMALKAVRGQPVELGELFSGFDRFIPMLAASFCMGVIVGAGLLFCIVPGVVASLGLSLTRFYVADTSLGPIESLTASWDATKGRKVDLLLIGLVLGGLLIAGFLACCVGVIPASVVGELMMAVVYTRLSGTEATVPAPLPDLPPPPGTPGLGPF